MTDEQASSLGNQNRSELQTLLALLNTMHEVSNMPMRKLMSTMQENVNVTSGLHIYEDSVGKSQITANDLKNQGTEYFAGRYFDKAIVSFTRCLSFTTEGSEEAAYAYANRSAVLFRFGLHRECIEDVDRALSGPYPDDKRQSLLDRKERCLALLEEEEHDRVAISRGEAKAEEAKEWRKMCNFNNALIPNASAKIKLGYDKTYGRHWLAAEDIAPGEILCSEPFYSTIKQPGVQYEYCSHCLTLCLALIPCASCSQVMYCSSFCRSEANAMYHRIECKFLELKEVRCHYQENHELMVLRTLLIGTRQGAALKSLMAKWTMEDILMDNYDPTGKLYTSDYWHVLKLRRVFPKPLINRAVNLEVIVATIIALRKVGFFPSDPNAENAEQGLANESKRGMSKEELFTALLLYNHTLSLKLSFKAVRAMVENDERVRADILLGLGLCTLCNMLNHSCNPQVRSILRDGQHIAMMSCRPIKKGEQIFDTYCGGYWVNPYAERVHRISVTHTGHDRFTCQCEACSNMWPMYSGLRSQEIQFVCDDVQQMQEEFSGIVLSFVKGNAGEFTKKEIFEFFCLLCTWMHERIQKPAFPIVDCEEVIYSYMTYFYAVGWLKERTVPAWKRTTNVDKVISTLLASRLYPASETGKEFFI